MKKPIDQILNNDETGTISHLMSGTQTPHTKPLPHPAMLCTGDVLIISEGQYV